MRFIKCKSYNFIEQMNSSELLSALNKQSQNKHHPKNKSSILETIPQKHEPVQQKENQFSSIKLPEEISVPPQFLQQILAEQKQKKLVNSSIQQAITKVRKQRQKNVYLVFNQSHIAYLSELTVLAAAKNEYATKSIGDVMLRRFNMVSTDLENGKLLINRDRSISTKEQVQQYADLDRARLLKIKQGAIRSKLDLLNSKMEEMEKIYQSPKNADSIQEINKKIQENLNSAGYGIQSEKTKIAKDYVRYMSEQRKQRKKRQQLREQRRLKYQAERQLQLKEAQQMRDLAKKQQILLRIQQKRKKRDQEEKSIAEKQDNIDKFLEKFRQEMPIFKKKEKEFQQKFLKPQKLYREQKLKQIKEKKKSYSLNDIVDHEKKYEELKRKETFRKINEKQMYLKSLKINTKQHYKGSAHKFVEEIDKANRQKNIALYQLGRNRQQRMIDYAKGIKDEHKPKIDETKRTELLKLLQKQHLKNNKIIKKYRPLLNSNGEDIGVESFYEQKTDVNRYKEGNKFMQEGNAKRKKNISQSVDASVQPSQKSQEQQMESLKLLRNKSDAIREKDSTEKQIWKLRSKQLAEMSVNLSSPKQFEQIKANFENMDKKAADKEALMKHTKMNVEQFIEQKGALDEFYLESIKNKIRLLE